MNAKRGDVKGMTLRNASDRNVESDLAIRMRENTTVGEGYANRRTRRNDWKGVSLGGVGETTRAVSPDVSRIGAVDAKAFLFAACFFSIRERTVRFSGIGRVRLRDQVCRSGILRFGFGIARRIAKTRRSGRRGWIRFLLFQATLVFTLINTNDLVDESSESGSSADSGERSEEHTSELQSPM